MPTYLTPPPPSSPPAFQVRISGEAASVQTPQIPLQRWLAVWEVGHGCASEHSTVSSELMRNLVRSPVRGRSCESLNEGSVSMCTSSRLPEKPNMKHVLCAMLILTTCQKGHSSSCICKEGETREVEELSRGNTGEPTPLQTLGYYHVPIVSM